MLVWMMENLGTMIVLLILLLVVGAIVAHMVRNKKAGKSSCGCGCSDCPMNGKCHS